MLFNYGQLMLFQRVQLNKYVRQLSQAAVFLLLIIIHINVQASGVDYKLKAAYIYQFTKFTHWPNKIFEGLNDPIRICVLGKNPFGDSLNSFSSRTSQKRRLMVEYYISLENTQNCQLIYISQSEKRNLKKILRHIERFPVLSVSDINGFAQQGGMIGFIPKNRKLGIEINIEASKLSDVSISSKLLEVATIVKSNIQEETP